MAKKNLASLMNGIMGESKPVETSTQELTEDVNSGPEIEEVVAEVTEPAPRRGVGRPRKGDTSVKSNEIRATFIIDPELVRKVKYISLVEGVLLKDVIAKALSGYVENWEVENNKIRLPKKK